MRIKDIEYTKIHLYTIVTHEKNDTFGAKKGQQPHKFTNSCEFKSNNQLSMQLFTT